MTTTPATLAVRALLSAGHPLETIYAVPGGKIGSTPTHALARADVEKFARQWEMHHPGCRPGSGRRWVLWQTIPGHRVI